MKKLMLLFTGCLLFGFTLQAQPSFFDQGNAAYKNGQYDSAQVYYENELTKNQHESVALHYNLGNTFFKQGNLGQAILHYERALKLNPRDEETLQNLAIVQHKTVDRFEELPQTLIQNVYLSVLRAFTPSTWAVLALCFLGVLILGLAAYLFSSFGRVGFVAAFAGLALGAFSLTMAYAHRSYEKNNKGAIILSDSAYVKSGPSSTAEDVLILHEGTKATVLQSFEDWRKIRLPDGKLGWIPAEDLELI